MHKFRTTQPARPIEAREREACVFNQINREAEIAGHAHGGFYGIVRDHSADRENGVAGATKYFVETCFNKCTVGLFRNDRLTGERSDLGLEVMTALTRTIRRVGLTRIVTNVIDRQAADSPGIEQTSDIALGIQIISRAIAAPFCVIDGVLHIDDNEGFGQVR